MTPHRNAGSAGPWLTPQSANSRSLGLRLLGWQL